MSNYKQGDKVLLKGVIKDFVSSIDVAMIEVGHGVSVLVSKESILSLDEYSNDKWTLIKNGLPETLINHAYVDVLVSNSSNKVMVAMFYNSKFMSAYNHTELNNVVAWKYLPEPYDCSVQLRDSCKGCKYRSIYDNKVFDTEGNEKKIQFCIAAQTFIDEPHFINDKPCHELEE